jgi:hypothetical protein
MKRNTKDKTISLETKRPGAGTVTVWINRTASDSARIYVDLILEACEKLRIDPTDAILNTDEHPRLLKVPQVEFAIGWLHGLAEAHELVAEQIWGAVVASDRAMRATSAALETQLAKLK